jgi:hypothetical protein
MTNLLETAFQSAARLPPEEQDRLASAILANIESEGRWDRALTESQDVLGRLASTALAEAESGKTEPLFPDTR